MKDSKKLLEVSMTVVVGGSDPDHNLFSKIEVFIKKKCNQILCIR
jgi:hypothetical protein